MHANPSQRVEDRYMKMIEYVKIAATTAFLTVVLFGFVVLMFI